MTKALTLCAYMHAWEGNLNGNRRTIAFEVMGMPIGEEAWVAEFHHRWKILRATAGNYGKWQGMYSSPEAAIAAIQTSLS
jgi:hypothetical protein